MAECTTIDASQNEFSAARIDGEFDARIFLQSLIEHGSAMSAEEAGEAFVDSVFSLDCALNSSAGWYARGIALNRKIGFLAFFGRMMYEQTEPQRSAVEAIVSTEKLSDTAIPLARKAGQKRSSDAG